MGLSNLQNIYHSKEIRKIDAQDVKDGLYNDVGEEFIKEYPYTIIADEDCLDATIEKRKCCSRNI